MAYTQNYVDKSQVSVTTTPVKIADLNTSRKVLLLFNRSAVAIRIYFDTGNSADYIEIPAGKGLNFFECVPMNEVWAVTASGSGGLTAYEA